MEQLTSLWDAAGGSPEADTLEVLTVLVSGYEAEHMPIELPDPIEAMRTRMTDLDLTSRDVARLLSVSEQSVIDILRRRRHFSLDVVPALGCLLGLTAECLTQDYDLVRPKPVRDLERTRRALHALEARRRTPDLTSRAQRTARAIMSGN